MPGVWLPGTVLPGRVLRLPPCGCWPEGLIADHPGCASVALQLAEAAVEILLRRVVRQGRDLGRIRNRGQIPRRGRAGETEVVAQFEPVAVTVELRAHGCMRPASGFGIDTHDVGASDLYVAPRKTYSTVPSAGVPE